MTEVVAYRTVVAEPEREGEPDIYRMLLDRRSTSSPSPALRRCAISSTSLGAEPAADLLRHDRRRLDRTGDRGGGGAVQHRDDDHAGAVHGAGARRCIVEHFREAQRHEHPRTHDATATALKLTRRLRRLRTSETMRALVRETRLSPDMFVLPLFVCEGEGVRREVPSMPGVFNLSVDEAVKEVAARRGPTASRACCCSACPTTKTTSGRPRTTRRRRCSRRSARSSAKLPDVLVITDVCLCEYTDHGHCGIVIDDEIANDPTVDQLVRAAVSHAAAGADIVAPSDMMDGRVGAIRQALDERGFENDGDHVVRGQVLFGVLRAVPRRRRVGAQVRRSPLAPDGSRERRRSAARGGARHRGRRRHRDGEAGAALSRRHRRA